MSIFNLEGAKNMFKEKERCYHCGVKIKKEGQEFNGHPCCTSCKIRKTNDKMKKNKGIVMHSPL